MSRYSARTLIGQPALANWGKAAAGGIGVVQGYGVATGGTSSSISPSSVAYTLLTFTSDDNLVVATAGLFDVLMVAGGGGSSGARTGNLDRGGSGGGAGGLIQTTLYLSAATYAVDVGAGGTGGANNTYGTGGFGSSIGTVFASPGGGVGGCGNDDNHYATAVRAEIRGGSNGGSGFNSTRPTTTIDGISGKIGGQISTGAGAGGGGFSSAGANNDSSNGGAGGSGSDVSTFITGSTLYKATGGGGGGNGGTPGAGGNSSANSNAGSTGATGNTASANSGSGGGGAGGTGGAGGSGIVYVRFKV